MVSISAFQIRAVVSLHETYLKLMRVGILTKMLCHNLLTWREGSFRGSKGQKLYMHAPSHISITPPVLPLMRGGGGG